ncbi:hypothetical protein CEXT_406401 [Caerostris extrusa]|uniref:Uncharacterized protein n=1 Tax=Caerostris extrusa TaxID=172846 RepID=A0AAV4QSC5_CAEEX|nr:hypothetical protein CEXT_406401 [Caerostris extrusa]
MKWTCAPPTTARTNKEKSHTLSRLLWTLGSFPFFQQLHRVCQGALNIPVFLSRTIPGKKKGPGDENTVKIFFTMPQNKSKSCFCINGRTLLALTNGIWLKFTKLLPFQSVNRRNRRRISFTETGNIKSSCTDKKETENAGNTVIKHCITYTTVASVHQCFRHRLQQKDIKDGSKKTRTDKSSFFEKNAVTTPERFSAEYEKDAASVVNTTQCKGC